MNNKKYPISSHFSSQKEGWRCRVKLMIGKNGVGLYKAGTHEIENACGSPDHHPIINEILATLKCTMLDPYDEVTNQGIHRALQITVDPRSGKAQVALFATRCVPLPCTHPAIISAWCCESVVQTNTLFRGTWHHLSGERYLPVCICKRMFFFHPATFIQANLFLFEKVVEHLRAHLTEGGGLAEYYAGIGVMGTLLADRFSTVCCIENNPYAEESFAQGRPPKHVRFTTSDAAAVAVDAGTSLLDPPRKGIDIKTLYTVRSPQLIYLSCNPKTFYRDAVLLEERGYLLKQLVSFDFFPGSGREELLGYFQCSED